MAVATSDTPAYSGDLPARAAHGAGPFTLAWRRLARNRLALFGSIVAIVYILLGI